MKSNEQLSSSSSQKKVLGILACMVAAMLVAAVPLGACQSSQVVSNVSASSAGQGSSGSADEPQASDGGDAADMDGAQASKVGESASASMSQASDEGGSAGIAEESSAQMDEETQHSPGDAASESADYSNVVSDFCYAFYDQWSFVDGEFNMVSGDSHERALQFVDPKSDIYAELLSGAPGTAGYIGVAMWVQSVDVAKLDDHHYLATVLYYGTQNNVTQDLFDQIVANGSNELTIEVQLNDEGLITWFGSAGEVPVASQEAQSADGMETEEASLADGFYLATFIAPGDHLLQSSAPEVNEASFEGDILVVRGAMYLAVDRESLYIEGAQETIGPKVWEFPIAENASYRFYGGEHGYDEVSRDLLVGYFAEPSGLGLNVEVHAGQAIMIGLSS